MPITAAPDINPEDVVTRTGEVIRNAVPEAKKGGPNAFLPLPPWLRDLLARWSIGDDVLLLMFIVLVLYGIISSTSP